jgi:hypothetical protein
MQGHQIAHEVNNRICVIRFGKQTGSLGVWEIKIIMNIMPKK